MVGTGALAYVFWHGRRDGVERGAYETALRAFHDALAAHAPDGFQRSCVFRCGRLPWTQGEAYEDWYLIDDFAALGRLNDAAVSGPRRPSHDNAAAMAAWGAAGVYKLVGGAGYPGDWRSTDRSAATPETAAFATWLSKPAGVSYDSFVARLRGPDILSSWQRQMVLGPAPEFCIFTKQRAVSAFEDAFAVPIELL